MKFRIGEDRREYEFVDFDRLTLLETLMLEKQTAEIGRPMSWSDLSSVQAALLATPKAERGQHPQFGMYFAIQLWVSRLRAGEKLSLLEALDFPVSDLILILGPGEVERLDPPAPRGGGAGSGRTGARAPRKASKRTSAAAS